MSRRRLHLPRLFRRHEVGGVAGASRPAPPRLAQALLAAALPAGLVRETVLGDFWEDYAALRRRCRWRARVWYWREAIGVSARSLLSRARRYAGVGRSSVGSGSRRGGSRGGNPGGGSGWRRLLFRLDAALRQDIPYGIRNLARAPGFTAVAVLSLALGIAPLAAVGGFVNAMFFRPLAGVPEQGRLVSVFRAVGEPISWPDLADAAAQADGLEEVAALSSTRFSLTEGEVTQRLRGASVSSNYFDVLGVMPTLGRRFEVGEMGAGADGAVIISYGFWQRRFAGSEEVLGDVLRIDGRDHTVVGVAPEGLLSPEMPVEPDIYVPLGVEVVDGRGRRGHYGIGRMRDGIRLEDVRAQLGVVQERLRAEYPAYWSADAARPGAFGVHPLQALRLRPGQAAEIGAALGLVAFLGLLVLMTACSNLGNLLLARGWQRGGEIAVRRALGADRATLVAMLLAESVVLGCAGGALGTLAAHGLTRTLEAGLLVPDLRIDLTLDVRVLAFTALVSLLTGIVFGLIPALRASRPDLSVALKSEPGAGVSQLGSRYRNVLVVAQVTASLALLVSAASLVRSLQSMQHIDPGFDAGGVLTVEFDVSQGSHADADGGLFFEQLAERLRSAPGVEVVALAVDLPLDGTSRWHTVTPLGIPDTERFILAQENQVSPDYFAALGMQLVRGRGLTDSESPAAPVVVINEAFERAYWPEGALGELIRITGDEPAQVVGVVRDAKYDSLGESSTPIRMWRPWDGDDAAASHLVVRAESDEDARLLLPVLRRLVAEADAELPFLEPRLLRDIVDASGQEQRVASAMLVVIGTVSLALALVGLYGVLSFVFGRRRREIGVRVALGARRADVVGMVLYEGMRLVAIGVIAGLTLAFGITQLLAAAFPGVQPLDPVGPLAAVGLLAVAAALAALVPALSASRVDAMEALRG